MRLSPSKVDCFFGCKRLFYYRYISKEKPKPSKYFLIGNVVHKTLELFHSKVHTIDRSKWSLLMKKAYKHTHKNYSIYDKLDTGFITEKDATNIKSMLQIYLNYIREKEKLPNTISAEKLFTVNLNSLKITGKADRVDRTANGIKIVDYKTSSRPTPKKEALKSVQLPVYGLWIVKGNDIDYIDEKIYGEYQYVRHLDKKSGIHTFEITGDMISNAIEKFTRVKFELDNGCKFEKNTDYKYCGRNKCDFYQQCVANKGF